MNMLVQSMIDTSLSRIKEHRDHIDQVVYALHLIKGKKDPRVLDILNRTVKDLSKYLSEGAAMGLDVNRDMAALLESQKEELEKLKQ